MKVVSIRKKASPKATDYHQICRKIADAEREFKEIIDADFPDFWDNINDDFTNILKAITAISAAKEEVMNFYLNKKEKELNQPKPKLLTL